MAGSWKYLLAKSLFWSNLLSIQRTVAWNRSDVTVIGYHAIGTALPYCAPALAVNARLFDAQVAYLKRHYRIISIDAAVAILKRGGDFPPGAAVLTFDDGYIDNYRTAFPILEKHGVTATFFVTAGPVLCRDRFWVSWLQQALTSTIPDAALTDVLRLPVEFGGRRLGQPAIDDVIQRLNSCSRSHRDQLLRQIERHVDEDAIVDSTTFMLEPAHLREMSEAGMTIGAHGVSHAFLPNLEEDEARDELVRGKALLEEALDRPVVHVAYPGSAGIERNVNDDVRRWAAEAGYHSAVTTEFGSAGAASDVMALPRKFVSGRAGVAGLAIRMEDHRYPLRAIPGLG